MSGFKIRVTVAAGGTFTLPLINTGTYNAIVYWGDGEQSTITSYDDADGVHTYVNAGDYDIEITGSCYGFFFNNTGDKLKLISVLDWGAPEDFEGFGTINNGFYGCINLTSLDSGPILVRSAGMGSVSTAWYGCTGLTTTPNDLFDYCTTTPTFRYTFGNCSNLTNIPSLNNCLAANNFEYFAQGCTKLQIQENIFCAPEDRGTRFLNLSVNFTSMFSRSSFSGSQGVAPPLWKFNFGTGTPTTTNCFSGAGNSATSLANYKNIPTAWGGAAVSAPTISSCTTPVSDGDTVTVGGADFLPYQYDAVLEFTNNATYASSTVFSPATVTAWGDSEITATFNQGDLEDGTIYAHVLTDRGDRNETGYSTTLEESATGSVCTVSAGLIAGASSSQSVGRLCGAISGISSVSASVQCVVNSNAVCTVEAGLSVSGSVESITGRKQGAILGSVEASAEATNVAGRKQGAVVGGLSVASDIESAVGRVHGAISGGTSVSSSVQSTIGRKQVGISCGTSISGSVEPITGRKQGSISGSVEISADTANVVGRKQGAVVGTLSVASDIESAVGRVHGDISFGIEVSAEVDAHADGGVWCTISAGLSIGAQVGSTVGRVQSEIEGGAEVDADAADLIGRHHSALSGSSELSGTVSSVVGRLCSASAGLSISGVVESIAGMSQSIAAGIEIGASVECEVGEAPATDCTVSAGLGISAELSQATGRIQSIIVGLELSAIAGMEAIADHITASIINIPQTIYTPRVILHTESDFHDLLYRHDMQNVFFNTMEFAISASYYHGSIDKTETYSIIFDDPHASVKAGNDGEFNSLRPQFQIPNYILRHQIMKSDRVTIRGKKYFVDDFIGDGVGGTTVYLRLK
jgi:predicted RNA binding protein with dsRBD fold (UPF0201 family)